MKYISTRGGIEPVSFREAVLMGLARDGGLLLPERIPDAAGRMGSWKNLRYADLATEVIGLYADMPAAQVRTMIERSYAPFRHPEITPVVRVGDFHILETFHGPTLAFKDVALQFLGHLFEHVLAGSNQTMNILGATSGDTGSAAIHGMRGRKGIRIFVMYPQGRVSRTQELQMTSVLDDNVFNLAVQGTFDDCQRILKACFNDLAFKDRYRLGAVNSINWARVLAQIVYYFYGAFRVQERTGCREVTFCVPTGNFGDIFAGYLAGRMGLPIRRLILATNANDILARFFRSGDYSLGKVSATWSPSMDIQVASNFERYLFYRVGEDATRLRGLMDAFARTGRMKVEPGTDPVPFVAGSCDDAGTLETIRDFHARHGYLLDPHSAVGVHVAQDVRDEGEEVICLATAHPAKFGEAIRKATGQDLAHHPVLDALEGAPTRSEVLPASADAVKQYIQSRDAPY